MPAPAPATRRRALRGAPSGPAPIAPPTPDQDVLDLYLADVARELPLLSRDDEVALARRMRRGDDDARERLIRANLRFVISVAKKYQNRGLPLVDLIAEGNVGLLTAARKFDPELGIKFISYAVWWIRQAVLAALAKHGRTVRVPLNRVADLARVTRATEIFRQTHNREPDRVDVAALTGLTEEVVADLQMLAATEVRLDAPMSTDGDRTVADRLLLTETDSPEAAAVSNALGGVLERALGELPSRDARVLRLYFGLEGGREHTLEEIGAMLGVTRERVRQLRDRAVTRLREGRDAEALRDYVAA